MISFAESGHPLCQATGLLEKGDLKSKGGGKKTIHYNGREETVEWIFARLFLSISSVSTDQSQTCATNYNQSMPKVRSVNLW